MSIETVLCIGAWLGAVLVGVGCIGVIGALFWAFDPRAIREGGE